MQIWQVVLLVVLSTFLIAAAPRVDRVMSVLQRQAWERLRGSGHEPSSAQHKILRFSRQFSRTFLFAVGLYAYSMTAYLVITRGVK